MRNETTNRTPNRVKLARLARLAFKPKCSCALHSEVVNWPALRALRSSLDQALRRAYYRITGPEIARLSMDVALDKNVGTATGSDGWMTPFLKRNSGWQIFSFVVLSAVVWEAVAAQIDKSQTSFPIPFSARLTVRTSEFFQKATTPYNAVDAGVVFSYSNGWWRIDATTKDLKTGNRIIQSCMTIPEGVRYIDYFPDAVSSNGEKLTPVAEACRISFPAPGRAALFSSWLALCPRPKLPFIDSARMHRLVYIPGCEIDILEDDRNVGTYSIGYYSDAGAFVSHLRINNDGVYIELNRFADRFEPIFHQFSPPRDSLEDEYTLLSTTNYNGYTFPARAVMKRMYSDTSDAEHPSRLSPHVISEIQVSSIGPFQGGGSALIPSKAVASDLRPTNLPNKNIGVDYMVTNDVWKPSSDGQIRALVEFERKRAAERGDR